MGGRGSKSNNFKATVYKAKSANDLMKLGTSELSQHISKSGGLEAVLKRDKVLLKMENRNLLAKRTSVNIESERNELDKKLANQKEKIAKAQNDIQNVQKDIANANKVLSYKLKQQK